MTEALLPLPQVVHCPQVIRTAVSGPIRHLCPYVDEVDEGTVTITWETGPGTIELHSLRAYLDTFAEQRISHEQLADEIRLSVIEALGRGGVEVTLAFITAGLDCEVVSA